MQRFQGLLGLSTAAKATEPSTSRKEKSADCVDRRQRSCTGTLRAASRAPKNRGQSLPSPPQKKKKTVRRRACSVWSSLPRRRSSKRTQAAASCRGSAVRPSSFPEVSRDPSLNEAGHRSKYYSCQKKCTSLLLHRRSVHRDQHGHLQFKGQEMTDHVPDGCSTSAVSYHKRQPKDQAKPSH